MAAVTYTDGTERNLGAAESMIKIWVRGSNVNKLDSYLKVFSENAKFIQW